MQNGKFAFFLEDRIDKFYSDTIEPRKNKKHLVLGRNFDRGTSSVALFNNDYLCVGNHPKVIESQINVLKTHGNGVVMSGVFIQGECSKKHFEDLMAEFVGYEASVLCQSGYAANVGLLQAIAGENVPVYIDFFAHASLWEGIKAAGARAVPFNHNHYEHLEKQIIKNGQGVILVDSLYSVEGTIAPLERIVEISEKYNCILVVDESHSLGTHGKNGSGLVSELGLTDRVDFITSSLAKTFAGRAGIVLCSKRFAGYFPYVSFPAIFSSVLLNHEIEGLVATLNLIKSFDNRRERLKQVSKTLRDNISALGYNIASESHIISIESGLEKDTEILRDALEENGVFGAVFCNPATPKNRSVIRFSLNSSLTYEQINYVTSVLEKIRDQVGMQNWQSTAIKRKSISQNLL